MTINIYPTIYIKKGKKKKKNMRYTSTAIAHEALPSVRNSYIVVTHNRQFASILCVVAF